MQITDEHRKMLQSLTDEPLTIYGGAPLGSPLLELVAAGMVKETAVNISEVLYEVTHSGREVGNG